MRQSSINICFNKFNHTIYSLRKTKESIRKRSRCECGAERKHCVARFEWRGTKGGVLRGVYCDTRPKWRCPPN